ncbi:flagellar assembly peptidoglycan hydrolase FlgJ [Crenobacter intestini]|uniref:Peptidoglycan hydrolase FlgJ n=1 Tax=Crenobacter intestini TaxID=2563443 RepID=A0A4T0V174_9NEIS|nr:flagellar assembly peptidoglycan hydrolase FlgJ [Crenobacter intestini]TIC85229.1 flagellar assembly peptidoglycan hydrolase FlgJ [Crenobacter intestini]
MSISASFNPAELSRQLALDPSAASRLSDIARKSPEAGVREVASQFESMLMETLVRAMRVTTEEDGEEDSSSMQTWRGMLDQQMVQAMVASGGIGLGDMLAREIGQLQQLDIAPRDVQRLAKPAGGVPQLDETFTRAALTARTRKSPEGVEGAAAAGAQAAQGYGDGARDFVEAVLPHARRAAEKLGVDPMLIVSHAALESGWGKRVIRHADGRDSYNLFGIKATGNWQGDAVATLTTEFVGGSARKQVEPFRAYPSLAAAFDDYAALIAGSPRYRAALGSGNDMGAYARALKDGGYATDPAYAGKLVAVARNAGV